MPIVRRLAQMIRGENDKLDEPLPAWGPSFMSSVISREDNRPDHGRPDHDFIHVSSLIKGWCPRKYTLMRRLEKAHPDRTVTGGHRVMWAVGRAVEHHVRTQFISGVNYQGVWGIWKCDCKKKTNTGFADTLKKCEICGTAALNYNEFTLKDKSDRVAGNPDLVFIRNGRIYPVEIKSMAASMYDVLEEPLADHLFQVFSYYVKLERLLAPAIGATMGKFAIMLYTTKDFKFGSPYKEYHATFEDHKWLVDGAIKPRLRGAKKAWDAAQDTEKPLPKKVCPKQTCPMARDCPVMIECFQM